MKLWTAVFLCVLLGAPAAQANPGGKMLRAWRNMFTKSSVPEVSFAQRRVLVGKIQERTASVERLNRLNLAVPKLPVLKNSVRSYYKTVALHFPEVSSKPLGSAVNTLEELAMDLPLSLKEGNVFVQTIPGITPPTETYMAAMFADAWSGWLESGIVSAESVKGMASSAENGVKVPPSELVFAEADIKRAQQLQRALSAKFSELYNALPAEQRDWNAQLKKVLAEVRLQTGWNDSVMEELERYFTLLLRPMIERADKLTPVEFLQGYDVLAVAGELPGRYQHRLRKGSSTELTFILSESLGRVKNRVPGYFGSRARAWRLQKWSFNLYTPKRVLETGE